MCLRIVSAICGMLLIHLPAKYASASCAVKIEADRLTGREYIGNVELNACSGRIYAPKAREVEQGGVILRYEFSDGVSYRQSTDSELIMGSSETAVFEVVSNRLQLFGKPRLTQGAVEQYGDPITHYINRQSLVPEGLDDRLRIVPDSTDYQRR